jgi:hypothetical protein
MRFLHSLSPVLLLVSVALLFTACNDTTVGPIVGNGTTLEATISGIPLTFSLNADPADPTYDPLTQRILLGGTIVGDTTKTVSLFFTFNVDQGTYPTTVSGTDANLVCVIKSGGNTQTYNCNAVAHDVCSVTLTAGNRTILDGTFAGTLSNSADSSKKITIANGKFSVRLRRI